MIDGLPPYADMRDTGQPWLPSIPAHWDVRRNGRLFSERRETGYPYLPILEVSLRSGVRIRDMEGGKRKQQIADRSTYQRALKGDIAYNMMRMWQGAVGVAPADGLVSPAYVVATAHEDVDPVYYAYLFRTDDYMKEIDSYSRGIVPDRNRLYWQAFKQMPSAYPPLDEQRLIARFLDWHGAMAAKLIRTKRRLIALLNEKKQSAIHRAVTRGLDPAVKLKPSGVDWLGDVPEHWHLRSLGSLTTPRSDRNRTDLPLLSVVREKGVIPRASMSREENHNFIPDDLSAYKVVKQGDLVVNKMKAWQGSLGIAASDGIVSPAYFVFELDLPSLEYGNLVLRSRLYADFFGRVSDGVRIGQWDLSIDGMKRIVMALPSIGEQAAILDHIRQETEKADAGITLAKDELALIQEFRTRLIADVVTGQLDVRGIAASLPDVVEADATDDLTDEDDLDDADALVDEDEAA